MKNLYILLFLVILLYFTPTNIKAQVSLVKDINQVGNTEPSHPSNLTDVNGILYFSAYENDDNGGYHYGLYKREGTNTVKLANSYATHLRSFNGILYFISSGRLYKSDGTAAGTMPVNNTYLNVNQLIVGDNMLYFTAWTGSNYSLWKSDGINVEKMVDLTNNYPQNLTFVNGSLYFNTIFYANNSWTSEIWKSDGTSSGTLKIAVSNGYDSGNLINFNNNLFYRFFDGTSWGLWKYDGVSSLKNKADIS